MKNPMCNDNDTADIRYLIYFWYILLLLTVAVYECVLVILLLEGSEESKGKYITLIGVMDFTTFYVLYKG